MRINHALKTALVGLLSNKGRSFLTILGVVIGIAAVISISAIGQGAQSLVIGQMEILGANNIFIEPGAWSGRMETGSMMQSMVEEMEIKTLKYEDALAVQELALVDKAAPFAFGVSRVVYENKSKKATFFGTTPEVFDIMNVHSVLGRDFTAEEVSFRQRVAVLGHKIKKDLFGEENPIGEKIRIKKTNFKVIGVIDEKGTQSFMNLDENIYLPITAAQNFLLGQDYIRWIIVNAKNEETINGAIEDIRSLLRERHNIYNPEGDPAKDDFKVMGQKETAQILGNITGIFTILLSSIAAISLLVGGIGIMNIMLVSVTERTKEIGLRKAVGASKQDILSQFLLEAVLLTFIGGVFGIVFGALLSYGTSLVFGQFLGETWGFLLPLKAVVLGVGVSIIIGLVFGIYPARKAAQLSPIEALRYE